MRRSSSSTALRLSGIVLLVVLAVGILIRRHATGLPVFSFSSSSHQLYLAIRMRDVNQARKILESNPDLISSRLRGSEGGIDLTPMQNVVMSTGDTQMADMLFARGANINASSTNEMSLLQMASNSSVMTEWLINHGANVNLQSKIGWTPARTRP